MRVGFLGLFCVTLSLSGVECGARITADSCHPGFVPTTPMGNCVAAPVGSPALHTESEVCAKWKAGHVVSTPYPFVAGRPMCDPGSMLPGGIADTMLRINTYRWMVGLGDVKDDATKNLGAQACAVITAWNPPGEQAHMPPASATCCNALGAMSAGRSSLAWGAATTDSIDHYIEDSGPDNYNTLGHRRFVLDPPLGLIGVGYFEGGSSGRAQCLDDFDRNGSGPSPAWYAFPPPGYAPISVTKWAWSFHVRWVSNDPRSHIMPGATIAVKNLATQADAPITLVALEQCCADDAISFYPKGWTPKVGEVYRVTVNTMVMAPITYEVSPVDCP
jgi:hypothetical protein